MKNAVYAGSFDPITLGHMEVVEKVQKLFDRVYVVISQNTQKNGLFSVSEKKQLIQDALQKYENVEVVVSDKLTVQAAVDLKADYLIRGVRGARDLESEMAIADLNGALASEVQTILVPASPQTQAISSSMIKEIASFGGDVTKFVSANVAQALAQKYEVD